MMHNLIIDNSILYPPTPTLIVSIVTIIITVIIILALGVVRILALIIVLVLIGSDISASWIT